MVLAELMCLDYPFEYENEAQRMKIISKVKLDSMKKFPEHYPQWVRDLTIEMLSLDQHDRPSAKDACILIEEKLQNLDKLLIIGNDEI